MSVLTVCWNFNRRCYLLPLRIFSKEPPRPCLWSEGDTECFSVIKHVSLNSARRRGTTAAACATAWITLLTYNELLAITKLAQGLFVHTLSSVTGTTILSAPLVQFDQVSRTKWGVLTTSAIQVLKKGNNSQPTDHPGVLGDQQIKRCITSP